MVEDSKIRPWLRLTRIANLPTTVSNIAAGYCLGAIGTDLNHEDFWQQFISLTMISCCLYSAGMILNDAFDADIDAIERPNRPIPAGEISRSTALMTGFALLLIPIAVFVPMEIAWKNGPGIGTIVAIVLAFAIVAYNRILKKTALAPLVMGLCRTLNIILGASFGMTILWSPTRIEFNQPLFAYAILIGIYIASVTAFARGEAADYPNRKRLAAAAFAITGSLGAIASLPFFIKAHGDSLRSIQPSIRYVLIVTLIGLPIIRRLWIVTRTLAAADIGAAIVTSLSSLIFLDAAVCFLARPTEPIYAMLVASLIVPVMLLRRVSSQT